LARKTLARKRKAGRTLVLLVLLGGLAGANYYRNLEAEREARKAARFAGYSDAALGQLADAYRSELAPLQAEYERLGRRAGGVRAADELGDAVREFERVQTSSRRLRDLATEVATREARLREIEQEQAWRARHAGGLALHLERLCGVAIAR